MFPENYASEAAERFRSEKHDKWAQDLLLEMVSIDNSPKPDIDQMRQNEEEIFKIIKNEIRVLCSYLKPEIHRVPIDARLISSHQYVTPPHYTKTHDRQKGLSIEETYANRSNLVIIINGTRGMTSDSPTICSHVDTVAPHLMNIKQEGGVVYGRGACDDKGSIGSIIEAMRLISVISEKERVNPLRLSVIAHFVIDEESGGNGALSLSLSEEWTSNNVLVTEITDLVPHRANRGALWYKVDLLGGDSNINPLMALAYIVLSLEDEGDKILGETSEGIFLKEHVQTSHGLIAIPPIGKRPGVMFGQHPSTVNGYIKLTIASTADFKSLNEVMEESIRKYTVKYGDKTLEKDQRTGVSEVFRHFRITNSSRNKTFYDVEIFGKTGHMGAIRQCDCAIIKMAYILNGLQELINKKRIMINVALSGSEYPNRRLILEGGQGFTASHNLSEIQSRIVSAVNKGIRNYLSTAEIKTNSVKAKTSFNKLHNDAYESPEGSTAWSAILNACRIMGIRLCGQEKRAWGVSCDARLYAKALKMLDPCKSARNVITFGAGSSKYAHSEAERVSISDVLLAGSTIALWAMELSRV